jgi:hypothetical protein
MTNFSPENEDSDIRFASPARSEKGRSGPANLVRPAPRSGIRLRRVREFNRQTDSQRGLVAFLPGDQFGDIDINSMD